jgi:hypothetical protein
LRHLDKPYCSVRSATRFIQKPQSFLQGFTFSPFSSSRKSGNPFLPLPPARHPDAVSNILIAFTQTQKHNVKRFFSVVYVVVEIIIIFGDKIMLIMIQKSEAEKSLARVPQDMAFDTDAMNIQFQRQAGLIRDAFMFVVKRQFTTTDIFNNITFTIDEFCQEMGYNKSELYRRLDIWDNRLKPPKLVDGHECDGLFEYALYRATTEKVVFNRWSKDNNPMVYTYEIFKSLEILYDKRTKKSMKRTYSVVLGADILNAAFARFFVLDYGEYKALAAKSSAATNSYRNFYVFFARMVATAKARKQHTFITSVNSLAKIFDYRIAQPKDVKKSIKRTLDTIQGKLHQPFLYRFVRDPNPDVKSNLQYHVLFEFSDELLQFYEGKILTFFWQKLREKASYAYRHSLTAHIENLEKRMRQNQEYKLEDFHDWWYSSAQEEEKESIINSLLKEIFPDV